MPELPEVETIARQLRQRLHGLIFERLRVYWPKSLQGEVRNVNRSLGGRRLNGVSRRGKYLLLEFEGSVLSIHLRMTGRLLFQVSEKEKAHRRAELSFADGTMLHFVDMRKFGRIRLWPGSIAILPALGPEPLRAETVRRVLAGTRSRRPIKSVLLDQGVLAGVGNIYADEALFHARIHPLTPACNLSSLQLGRLSLALPTVLASAIANRGTTLRDYRQSNRRRGSYQFSLRVYGRAGEGCSACGRAIRRIRIAGRSSHFCPCCQRRGKPFPAAVRLKNNES